MNEADETLKNVFLTKGKWKLILSYYACYNALYSILMKCGIKSEIHECTIELMSLFDFEENQVKFLRNLKDDRIANQYYLKNIELQSEKKISEFVLECKTKLVDLNSAKIFEIRSELSALIK